MNTLQDLQRYYINHDALVVELGNGSVEIRPLFEQRVRVIAHLDKEAPLHYFEPKADPEFANDTLLNWQNIIEAKSSEEALSLPFGKATLHVRFAPFAIQIIECEQILYQDLALRSYLLDGNGRRWHYHQREDQDRYYGLGEKSGRLERTGRRFKMNNVDAVGYNPESGDPLYKHIPYLMRYRPSQGYCVGMYYHNASESEFDIGCERSGYWGEFASYCSESGPIDVVIMWGKSPQEVNNHYLDITGLPSLPTKASLGYMGSTMYYTELDERSDNAVLGFIDQCQYQGIPISGFHLSSGYTSGEDGLRYTFNWNHARFPEPHQFVQQLSAKGKVLSPNVKPGLLTSHPLYKQFDQQNAFIKQPDSDKSKVSRFWGGMASFVDFSHPDARTLWTQHLNESLIRLGITSIWNDNNEFELDGEAQCHGDGRSVSARKLRPILSNLMAQTAYDAVAKHSDKRPFILSRAGFAGIQRYAQTWSGDNDSSWSCFRYNIATMLGMSWSGVAFNGMDIGGFTGPAPQPELFLRWVQNGIFHPRFCIHSVNSDNTVTEPWIYPELLPEIREAFRLRYQLLPTLYSRAEQCHREGVSMVSALAYDHIKDSHTHQLDTCFMLSDSLLCVAITEPGMQCVEQYLPQGSWFDWHSGKSYTGGEHHSIEVEWSHSPLFMRHGSAVFLDQAFSDSPQAALKVVIGGAQSGQASFYDDDGETLAYQSGHYRRTTLDWVKQDKQTTLTIVHQGDYTPSYAQVQLAIKVDKLCPLVIKLNGEPLSRALYEDKLTSGSWHFDVSSHTVNLQLDSRFWSKDQTLDLEFEQAMQISQENQTP